MRASTAGSTHLGLLRNWGVAVTAGPRLLRARFETLSDAWARCLATSRFRRQRVVARVGFPVSAGAFAAFCPSLFPVAGPVHRGRAQRRARPDGLRRAWTLDCWLCSPLVVDRAAGAAIAQFTVAAGQIRFAPVPGILLTLPKMDSRAMSPIPAGRPRCCLPVFVSFATHPVLRAIIDAPHHGPSASTLALLTPMSTSPAFNVPARGRHRQDGKVVLSPAMRQEMASPMRVRAHAIRHASNTRLLPPASLPCLPTREIWRWTTGD